MMEMQMMESVSKQQFNLSQQLINKACHIKNTKFINNLCSKNNSSMRKESKPRSRNEVQHETDSQNMTTSRGSSMTFKMPNRVLMSSLDG